MTQQPDDLVDYAPEWWRGKAVSTKPGTTYGDGDTICLPIVEICPHCGKPIT